MRDVKKKNRLSNPPRPQWFRRGIFPPAIGLVLYLASYGYFRVGHSMVHRIGYCDYTYTEHSVAPGNAWFLGSDYNNWIAMAYTPLRRLEVIGWYIARPPGTQLLYRHRKHLP
jgi:hypothetical protein